MAGDAWQSGAGGALVANIGVASTCRPGGGAPDSQLGRVRETTFARRHCQGVPHAQAAHHARGAQREVVS